LKGTFLLFLFLSCGTVWAGDGFPALQVVPWNGHKAATSLTFDDGDHSHLDVAIPELDQRGMKATFFLIANQTDRKDDWRKIIAKGHEIGNHSLDHRHPAEMTAQQQEAQVVGANHVLQKEFGVQVRSFAYPFTEITSELRTALAKADLLARGGYGKSFVLTPDMDPDWLDIPARMTETQLSLSTYKKWIAEDLKKRGWMVWMIHGLEGSVSGWNPISKKNFEGILDGIASKDIWVGTFTEVGSYFMGAKILDKVVPKSEGDQESFNWELPESFPAHVFLKVRLKGKGSLWQAGKRINPDETGLYIVDLGQKSLSLRRK
jgi:peptidoglycan/xylan/chitin deacetylase (PgdA/CDA1 family)